LSHSSDALSPSAAPLAAARPDPSDTLWAITTYFNPLGYTNRRRNYRVFRELLPVPLIAVEYSVADFELCEGDAEILVSLRGRDVMWQKERLYNLARRYLPAHCEQVLWIDCDVVLGGAAWPTRLKEALRAHALVQPFDRLALLGPGVRPPPTRADHIVDWRTSIVAYLAGPDAERSLFSRWGASLRLKYFHGAAWAAQRQLCDAFEFYDRMIVGGGDKAFTGAVFGHFREVAHSFAFDAAYHADYLAWAERVHRRVGGSYAHLEVTACHLWHGALSNRGYDDRQRLLHEAGFEAMADLAIDPETSAWRWATDKPGLHDYVRSHFARRREDG
jgi:hypothetical protein